MTLLIWELAPESVVILSDTLSLSGDTKLPRRFMTKVYPAPHIGAVITGTGISPIIAQFYLAMIEGMVVSDVVHLSDFAPDLLRELWSNMADQLPDDATTTIYTFGVSQDDGQFVGMAYRSTADFEPELLQHGLAAKPAPEMEQLASVQSLADLAKLALHQQTTDRALPRQERIGIGGDLWMYHLRKADDGSLTMSIERLARLPHFEDDHELMLAQLPENQGHPRSLAALAREQEGT